MERQRQRTAEIDPRNWPQDGEEVEAWDVEDWQLVERAVRRLRVRPADGARKAKLLRGVKEQLARWITYER